MFQRITKKVSTLQIVLKWIALPFCQQNTRLNPATPRVFILSLRHTQTQTLYTDRQAPVTWHYYVSDSKGTGLTSLRRVSCTVGNGGEGSVPLCSRDVGISPPSEDMHYLVYSFIAIHCSSHCNSKLIKINCVGPVTFAVTRRGDAVLRTLLSAQMLAGNSLDTSHLLCGKTALCLNLVE